MSGMGVKLPLQVNTVDGPYVLNKTYAETVKQNLKMLLLTIPGERVMDPLYGVGIFKYLFELKTSGLSRQINRRVHEQVSKYMPFLELTEVAVDSFDGAESSGMESNSAFLQIRYRIIPFDLSEILTIPL